MPVLATEQYPRGLGRTCAELNISNRKRLEKVEKTQFSMLTEALKSKLPKSSENPAYILFGLEAHVCIYQTALDLLRYNPQAPIYIPADGVASRYTLDYKAAVKQLRHLGITVTSSESIIFEYLQDAKHPNFKAVSALFKDRAK